jgi:hypothetical protein
VIRSGLLRRVPRIQALDLCRSLGVTPSVHKGNPLCVPPQARPRDQTLQVNAGTPNMATYLTISAHPNAPGRPRDRRLETISAPATIATNDPPIPGLLSNVATLQRYSVPTNLNQTNIQRVYDIYAGAQVRERRHHAAQRRGRAPWCRATPPPGTSQYLAVDEA